jgi:hypothetical protein
MAAQAGPIPPTWAAPRRAGSGVFISSTPEPCSAIRRAAARAVRKCDRM